MSEGDANLILCPIKPLYCARERCAWWVKEYRWGHDDQGYEVAPAIVSGGHCVAHDWVVPQ